MTISLSAGSCYSSKSAGVSCADGTRLATPYKNLYNCLLELYGSYSGTYSEPEEINNALPSAPMRPKRAMPSAAFSYTQPGIVARHIATDLGTKAQTVKDPSPVTELDTNGIGILNLIMDDPVECEEATRGSTTTKVFATHQMSCMAVSFPGTTFTCGVDGTLPRLSDIICSTLFPAGMIGFE